MTTMSSECFQGLGASSSSIEADYLSLSVDSVHDLALLVSEGLQLNESQCQDLSSKLVQTVVNIQKLVPPSGPLKVPFGPALKNLYRVLEKAKLLVCQCCATDWCRAAVFQIHNEGAFREVLLEVRLCYNVIYEVTKGIIRDWVWPLIQALDLRQSTLFLPAPESKVRKDQETLKRRLQHVAGTSDDRNSYLARYLLGKLESTSAARMNADLSVPDASLWMNETEPQGTWKLQRVIGSGSGASCVCCYEWLGIPCARKEFHCRVADGIFRKEAAILAHLNHPNIVKFFCCSNDPEMGECFIAMELMEMSLASLIESRAKARRSFPILLVLDIMTQIARGVCYLHGLKIAHRDLKPLNVVVTETRAAHLEDCFCVKLVDFGMSKTKVQVSKSNTISTRGVGTTKYRAPEVFPQAQEVAPGLKRKVNWFRADAYCFGITCAELLSLKRPFEDVPGSELYEELLRGVRPELPGECPEDLVALLKDCWATDPQSRPGFAEICSRLEQCKLQAFLRVSSEGLDGLVGSEYIESVSMKQSREQSPCATRVPYVQSQCSSTVSFVSDAAKVNFLLSNFMFFGRFLLLLWLEYWGWIRGSIPTCVILTVLMNHGCQFLDVRHFLKAC